MISIGRQSLRLCDGISRREVLRIGALGVGGLTLAGLLRLQETQGAALRAAARVRARNCILLFMSGGPSQLDTFDLKPNAPAEVRGPFKPSRTNVSGIDICEHLPLLAQRADRYALVRSACTGNSNHSTSGFAMLTGRLVPSIGENNPTPRPSDPPSIGSNLWKLRGESGPVPPYVVLPGDQRYGIFRGYSAGYLGKKYDPLDIRDNYNSPRFKVTPLEPNPALTPERLADRRRLSAALDRVKRETDQLHQGPVGNTFDAQHQRAFDLLTSPRVRTAFDLSAEPAKLRERYGRTTFGQAVLLARRLLEHEVGVSLVTIFWSSFEQAKYIHWDTHSENFPAMKEVLLPSSDAAVSALLDDLGERGMLEDTLVVWMGDFGRTPKINGQAGRDHWGNCFSLLLAGGGIKGGQVYGASDRNAAYPHDVAVSHGDIHATIYHALGIDVAARFIADPLGRDMQLCDPGMPIARLFA